MAAVPSSPSPRPPAPLACRPACLQPQPGTLFTLEVEGSRGAGTPPPPGAPSVPLLAELAGQRRTFSVKYMQRAFLEVEGKLVALGSFNADLSNDTTHVSTLRAALQPGGDRAAAAAVGLCRPAAAVGLLAGLLWAGSKVEALWRGMLEGWRGTRLLGTSCPPGPPPQVFEPNQESGSGSSSRPRFRAVVQ